MRSDSSSRCPFPFRQRGRYERKTRPLGQIGSGHHLASGIFYSTGVSACILFLNNKKSHKHKGHICLIDGTEIYTPKRAQNELSPNDVKTLYGLYADFTDAIEKCKVVTIKDMRMLVLT